MIKALGRTKWGCHPAVLLRVYKVLALPHLDYASILYGRCSKANLKRLVRAQYALLRTALSVLKTTPTNAILFEAAQQPLSYRRRWLAYKYITKIFRIENHPVLRVIGDHEDFEHLWARTTMPPLFQALSDLAPKKQLIRVMRNIPYFNVSLQVRLNRINVINSGLP